MSRRPKPPEDAPMSDYIGILGCFIVLLALLWLA